MAVNSASGISSYNTSPVTVPSTAASLVSELNKNAASNTAVSASEAAKLRDWQVQQNKLAMDFNSAEAAKNRDWQAFQSNTAHQREIKDLKAAGLNPILSALGGSGAAVTSGATASGVTSSGAKGDVDTSANSAITSLLGSFLQAQTRLQEMNTNAITNLAVADKYNAMSKYTADLNSETSRYNTELMSRTQLTTSNIHAAASKYVAGLHLEGVKQSNVTSRINSFLQSETSKAIADKNYLTQTDVANINQAMNKHLKEMDIDARFDFADLYPSNAWQHDPDKADAREDLGSYTDAMGSLMRAIGLVK